MPVVDFALEAIKNTRLIAKLGKPRQKVQFGSPANTLDAGQRATIVPHTAPQQSRVHSLVRQHSHSCKTGVICSDSPNVEQTVSSGAIERACRAVTERPDDDARHISQKPVQSSAIMLRHERHGGGNILERDVARGLRRERVDGHPFDDCLRRKSADDEHEQSINNESDRIHLAWRP
jgi:hypothetical protein